MQPSSNIAPSAKNVNPPAPPSPKPEPIRELDADEKANAENGLHVGQVVEYTELVDDRSVNVERAKNPRKRAAVVVFVLDDGSQRRPVLRVFNPMAPPMAEMPAEGVIHSGVSLGDFEVYAPKYHPDSRVQNTWRPIA